MERLIKKTADGSYTLFVPELDEHYHSTYGAVQESVHVFIRMGLEFTKAEEISILEVGFGTGLNALLSFLKTSPSKKITYHALEKFPLSWELAGTMEYSDYLQLNEEKKEQFKLFHVGAWGSRIRISDHFSLEKTRVDLGSYSTDLRFDLVYFDAFAPEVQPEMWEESIFQKLFSMMKEQGILVTYCAKGEIRRRMERSGFVVERLAGPPGKREMLRATRIND